jgi:hypothetical protein
MALLSLYLAARWCSTIAIESTLFGCFMP